MGLEIEEAGKVFPIGLDGDTVISIPPARPIHLASEKNGKKEQDEKVVVLGYGQISGGRDKPSEEEIEHSEAKDQADKALPQKHLMRDNLKGLNRGNQLYVSDDEEKEGEVKKHQDDPKERLEPSRRRQQKGVSQGPEPPRPSFREDLQCRRMLRLRQELDESDYGSHHEYRTGNIDHGDQYDIVDDLHRNLLYVKRLKRRCPLQGAPGKKAYTFRLM
jgi:hypothetical protein